MRVRPPRLTVQQLVGLVAVAALVLAGPLEFIRYKLQEHALICRRVVEQSKAVLPGIEARVSSLETRIARFTQQSPSVPRYERWVNDLATYRGLAMRVRTDIDVFQ